nr:MAG TPA: hypothetical protein [Caudoviricetes sp.]
MSSSTWCDLHDYGGRNRLVLRGQAVLLRLKTQPSWEPTAREKLRPRGVISSLDMGAETP